MSYTHNKAPKDPRFCQTLKRAINLDRKRNGFSWEDAANELGLNGGTLENKLKPSFAGSDITISELVHFMELSGDMSALEYLANKFDHVLICKRKASARVADINLQVDRANMENSDVFRVVKKSLEDGVISEVERESILKEIDEAQKANAELKDMVLRAAIKDD